LQIAPAYRDKAALRIVLNEIHQLRPRESPAGAGLKSQILEWRLT